MNTVIDQIYATRQVLDADERPVDAFGPSVPYETGRLLYDLIREKRLTRTLEVGMAYGTSTLFICQALADQGAGRHTAIDPNQDDGWHSIGRLNARRAGLDKHLRFMGAKSCEALPELCGRDERFDFAFIDGMHRFDYVLVDFFYVDQLLETGGYLVMDDLDMPAISKAVSFILRNRNYERVSMQPGKRVPLWKRMARIGMRTLRQPLRYDYSGYKLGCGNACVLRKTGQDQRSWDHHRSF
jgi:predicted O-methyltransferase YrrM